MSTLEQVYLDRQRMKEESQGATESTRSALSAVSGRNILKTKEETAKIKRDEANAAAKTAAQIAQNDAALGVTAAKAENAVAVQKDKTLRQEALRMLNLGVYDPKMPAVLGMPENTVRSAAENRAEVYRRAEEQKKAAAKAKSDYEAAVAALRNQEAEIADLQKKQAANQRELSAAEKNLAAAIDEFEKANASSLNVNTAKDEIFGEAYKTDVSRMSLQERLDFIQKSKMTPEERTISAAKEVGLIGSKGKVRNLIGEHIQKAIQEEKERKEYYEKLEVYYDELMTEKIAAKKEAGEKLSLLEMTFQAASEKSISANITAARLKKDSAETMEEYQSAYQAYLDTLNGAVGYTMIAMEVALGQAADRSANYEQLTEEEQSNVKDQISAAESLVSALRRELQVEDFTIEQQDALSANIESVEAMIVELKKAEEYAVTYEEYKDTYAYQQMDAVYGSFSITDLEAEIARLKETKKELPVITRANAFEATPAYAEALKNNKAVDEQIKKLQGYLESRITAEKQAEEDVEADALISHFAGENRIEKELSAISSVRGEVDDYERYDMFCSLYLDGPSGAPTTTEDVEGDSIIVYKNADGEVEGYGYITSKGDVWRLAVVGSDEYNANMAKVNYDKAKEQLRLLTASFHRNIGEDAVALFDETSLEAAASAFSEKYDKEEFENLDGVHRKYAKGLEGYNEGNYGDFYEDVDRFVRGDYGKWTKEEAQRVLALMENEGTDVGFLYYASVREDVLLRVAEDLNGFARTMGGLVSGPANFVLNGGTMIKNALEQDYARIAGNGLTASHQVNLQKMEEMGFAGDALEMLYMSGYSIIDMLPTVALATIPVVGKAASSGYFFAKVTAETYTADIAQGKRSDESFTHSILNAIAEVAMERILGGIPQIASKSGLGAKLGAALENLASTPVMKKVLKVAGSMGAEGFEEFAQEVISPFLAKVAADVNGISDAELEQIDWDEAAKSFAIGAITGGFFDIIDISGENVRSSASYQMLASGDAVSMIEVGARLGNKRALEIKYAIQQEKPRYQGQQGLFAYASVGDMNNIQKSIKRRGAKKNLQALSAKIDAKMKGADTANIRQAKKMFQKIIYGKTLTVQEAAQIINDPVLKSIFEDVMGMDITYLMPNEMAALARLAAFMDENGKISKGRLDLFRDTFGEIDYKAIEQLMKYSDLAGNKLSGILYENAETETTLTETEQEAVEAMNIVSDMTGILLYVTDGHATGDFLAPNIMAVNRKDMNQGAFYLIGYESYFLVKQQDQELGADVKEFLLAEAKRILGEEDYAEAIKNIRQQGIVGGREISNDSVAEDVLCAQMMPSIMLKGAYAGVDRLAEHNIQAAELLRKTLGAAQKYISVVNTSPFLNEIKKKILKSDVWSQPLIFDVTESVLKPAKTISDQINDYFMSLGGEVYNQQLGKVLLLKTGAKSTVFHGVTEEKMLAVGAIKDVIENGKIIDSQKNWKGRGYDTHLIVGRGMLGGKESLIGVVVKTYETKGQEPRFELHEAIIIEATSNAEASFDISRKTVSMTASTNKETPANQIASEKKVTQSEQFVNGNLYQLLFDGISEDTSNIYDRLTERIKAYRAEKMGYRNKDRVSVNDFDGSGKRKEILSFEKLPEKAKVYVHRAKRDFLDGLGLSGGKAQNQWIHSIVEKMAEEYWRIGEISQQASEMLHDATDDYMTAEAVSDLVDVFSKKMQIARRYGNELIKSDVEQEDVFSSSEQVAEAYKQLKKLRKKTERIMARNLLTEDDQKTVGRLLRGELKLEDINDLFENANGIKEVYVAKADQEDVAKKIRAHRSAHKQQLREQADSLLENANNWKDKTGFFYQRETMERNIRDIATSDEEAQALIDWAFKPVHEAEAAAVLLKRKYRERVEKLKISRKVKKGNVDSESYIVQLIGEAEDNVRYLEDSIGRVEKREGKTLDEWNDLINSVKLRNPNIDWKKIENAIREFHTMYDELFDIINEVRARNGYEPIDYRRGYFLHFRDGQADGMLAKFSKALGITAEISNLPTTINGLTHTFKPGIRWFGSTLRRKSYETEFDAVEGFDRYIESAASIIFQTDNIQRLRALEVQIRYRAGDDGIRQQIDKVFKDDSIDDEDKADRIKEIYEKGEYALSNFVVELGEYINLLANKRSRGDRDAERTMGRRIYNIVKWAEGRVAANMIAGNFGTWVTNLIPIFQGGAELEMRLILKAQADTIKAIISNDGFEERSVFLTNRRGSGSLVRTMTQRVSDYLGVGMEIVDMFAANTLVRARYEQNIEKGLSEQAAIEEADAWAAGVMADRSKGAMPTLFERKSPIAKAFTMFQLEVNNQLSYLFKDIPRRYRKQWATAGAMFLLRFLLYSLLYNDTYEKVWGRRPALDPIGLINESVGNFTGYELPNVWDVLDGKASFESETKGVDEAITETFSGVMEQLPFISGLMGGGRLPIQSAIPDWENLLKALASNEWNAKKRWDVIVKEGSKPLTYLALPFAGGQLKKAIQSVEAFVRHGSYSMDADGNDILQYPVSNIPFITGKSGLPEAQEWVKSGFDSLSAKETAAYQTLIDMGVSVKSAYEAIVDLQDFKNEKGNLDRDAQRNYILSLDMTDEQKYVLYENTINSEGTKEALENLVDDGVLKNSIMEAYAEYRSIDSDPDFKSEEKNKATEFAYFLDQTVSNQKERNKIKESKTFQFGVLGAVRAKEYEAMTATGVSFDDAYDTYFAVAALEPKTGEKSVATVDQYLTIDEMDIPEDSKKAALMVYGSDADKRRMTVAFDDEITSAQFVRIKKNIEVANEAAGKKTASNARIQAAIDATDGLTVRQKAVLWQVFSSADTAKNNPYSVKIGAEALAKINLYKESEE